MYQHTKQENKLTVGFRCSPQTKLRLMDEANQNGVSLSEYLESLIERSKNTSNNDTLKSRQLFELQQKIEVLNQRVAQYETPLVKQLFQDVKANPLNSNITDYPIMIETILKSFKQSNK